MARQIRAVLSKSHDARVLAQLQRAAVAGCDRRRGDRVPEPSAGRGGGEPDQARPAIFEACALLRTTRKFARDTRRSATFAALQRVQNARAAMLGQAGQLADAPGETLTENRAIAWGQPHKTFAWMSRADLT